MKLNRLRARGHAHLADFDVDFSALPAGLVAICGTNGSGKSSLLNLFPGSLYRATPTGPLKERLTAKDSFVEASVVNGQPWTIKHLVDGVSGKGASSVLDDVGQSVTWSGGSRAFDVWSAKTFPPENVFYTSIFSSQGSQGFAALGESERKAVILRVVGVERLEALAEKAREQLRAATEATRVIRARLDDERTRGGSVEEAMAALEQARQALVSTEGELRHEARALAAQEAVVVRLEAEEAKAVTRRHAEAQLATVDAELADVRHRIENNRGLVDRKVAIEAAVAEEARLKAEAAELETEIATMDKRLHEADVAYLDAERGDEEAPKRLEAFDAEKKAAEALVREVEKREAICLQIAELKVDEKRAAYDEAERNLDAERGISESLAERRIESAIEALMSIRDRLPGRSPELIAEQAISADKRMVAEADPNGERKRVEAQRAEAAKVWKEAHAEHHRLVIERDCLHSERHAVGARALLSRAETERARQEAAVTSARQLVAMAWTRRVSVTAEWAALRERAAKLDACIIHLATTTKLAAHLAVAEERIGEYQTRADALEIQRGQLTERIASLPKFEGGNLAEETLRLDICVKNKRAQEAAVATAQQNVGRAEAKLETARTSEQTIEKLQVELDGAEEDVSDWKRIVHTLGRDGLQAIAVSDAAPELGDRANDILSEAFGSRFSVSFETQKLDAKGKRDLETFDVKVHDSEKHRIGNIETFSGGERVIIGEAVSLALAAMSCASAGLSDVTLVRDESGAALDADNGPRYIAMLRRAARMCGARHVLYVSHDPRLQEMADAKIVVADGKVSVGQ